MGREVATSFRMVRETASRKVLSPEMTWHVYRTPRRQCDFREVINKELWRARVQRGMDEGESTFRTTVRLSLWMRWSATEGNTQRMTAFDFHIKRDTLACMRRYRVQVMAITIIMVRHVLTWTNVVEAKVKKSGLILRKILGFANGLEMGCVTRRQRHP